MSRQWSSCNPFKISVYKEFGMSVLTLFPFFLLNTFIHLFHAAGRLGLSSLETLNTGLTSSFFAMRILITAILSIVCHSALTWANAIDKRASSTLSPTVQSPSPEYVKLLNHSILFFEAQRSGKLPDDNRVPW